VFIVLSPFDIHPVAVLAKPSNLKSHRAPVMHMKYA